MMLDAFDLTFIGKEAAHRLSQRLQDAGLHPLVREKTTWRPADGDTSFELAFDPAHLGFAVAKLVDAIRERQIVQFYRPAMPPALATDNVVVVASNSQRLALMVVRHYAIATNATSYRFVVYGRASETATRVRSGRELLTW